MRGDRTNMLQNRKANLPYPPEPELSCRSSYRAWCGSTIAKVRSNPTQNIRGFEEDTRYGRWFADQVGDPISS